MEFISEDIAAKTEPFEAELSTYLQTHLDRFHTELRFSFSQVYLNPPKRGDQLASDAAELLAHLQQSDTQFDIGVLGDTLKLPHQFKDAYSSEVTNLFWRCFRGVAGRACPGPVAGAGRVRLRFASAADE